MRQRGRTTERESTSQETKKVEPVDEADQEKLIAEFETDMEKQKTQMHWYFGGICVSVTVVGLLFWVLDELRDWDTPMTSAALRPLRWSHVALTVYLHWEAYAILNKPADASLLWIVYVPFALTTLLAASVLMMVRREEGYIEEMEFLHQAYWVGNLVTTASSFGLRYEAQSTYQAIADLKAAKYSHKTL